MMHDIGTFIREIGFPIFIALVGAWCLYKIGQVVGTLMIDAWKGKDARLAALELRVQEVTNGQRTSLEKHLNMALEVQKQSVEVHQQVADAMHDQAESLRGFVRQCPLATDSDADKIAHLDPKAVERVERQRARKAKRDAGESP